ncbi:MAG TPA: hypothetical protein EYQ61_03350 [Dehalococcoidia bacterium]|nr:hypothetical protein [Dehalococcoidia bacterium]HIK90285.1 hypothetical protein [Dehalococcoidia bacterium]
MNRIRSVWLSSFLLAGLVMLVVSGCASESEQEQLDNYRDRIGPAYTDVREAQEEFGNSVQQTVNLNTAESSATDSVEVVLARASKFQTSAGILISILGSEKPLQRCIIYNSMLSDLMEAYSSLADLVIEELDLLSGGTAGSLADREFETIRLEEEINLLVTVLPRAEIDCFVNE